MSTIDSLTPPLRSRLGILARHLRRRLLLGGCAWLMLCAVALFLASFFVDLCFSIPLPVLRSCLAGSLVVLVMAGLRLVLLPMCRAFRPETLAAVIERQHPDFGERLSSTVELAGKETLLGHGSPTLIALLERDTEGRLAQVNIPQTVPLKCSVRVAVFAALLLLFAAAPALVWERYAEFGQRFLLSWVLAEPRLAIDVSPGDAAVARGRPLTLTGKVRSPDTRLPLPQKCQLIFRLNDGTATRIPLKLTADGTFSFHFDTVPADIHYHVEAGNGTSPSFKLSAVVPVELVANPVAAITPPDYVNAKVHPPRTEPLQGDLQTLQYSKVQLRFQFNRPPRNGVVELRVQGGDKEWKLPLSAGDGTDNSWDLPVLLPGVYSLTLNLLAEHDITTRRHLTNLTIWSDSPPQFAEVPRIAATVIDDPFPASASQTPAVPPDDSLPLKIKVEDKVGLDRIDLEYRVNGGGVQRELIADAHGQPSAAKECRFQLSGKVKHGDVFAFRIKATDNRRVSKAQFRDVEGGAAPPQDLKPQVTHEPPQLKGKARWFVLRIDERARPSQEQEILAQRDAVAEKLQAIKKVLRGEQHDLKGLLAEHAKPSLDAALLARKLTKLRKDNDAARQGLQQLAETLVPPEALQGLAALAQDLAHGELSRSEQSLAEAQGSPADVRGQKLHAANKELAGALARLETMLGNNERLAAARLVQAKMAKLAQRQEDLATHSKTASDLDKLSAAEDRLAKDLKDAADQYRLVRKNPEQAELMAKQAELADKIAKLLAGAPSQADQTMVTKQARDATAALKKGDGNLALQMQQATAHSLERLAEEWNWGLELNREPAKAISDLARLQAGLVKSLEKLGEDFARLRTEEVRRRLKELERRQQELRKTTQTLKLPSRDAEVVHKHALEQLTKVLEWFERRDFLQAHEKMEQAQVALEQLSRLAPSVPVAAGDSKAKVGPPDKAAQARNLAQKQKELQGMVQKLAPELRQVKDPATSDPEMAKLAQAVQKGQERVDQALAKLRQGSPEAAQPAMQQAAQALREAANQAGKQLAQLQKATNGPPSGLMPGGAGNHGKPDMHSFPRDLQKYLGRPWGKLPGELRTRILQDARARFGDDYARIIQSYFEKIAAEP